MTSWRKLVLGAGGVMAVGFAPAVWSEQGQNGSVPVAVEERQVDIMSEGVRIHADVYAPKSAAPGPLPTMGDELFGRADHLCGRT